MVQSNWAALLYCWTRLKVYMYGFLINFGPLRVRWRAICDLYVFHTYFDHMMHHLLDTATFCDIGLKYIFQQKVKTSINRTKPYVKINRTKPYVKINRTKPYVKINRTKPYVKISVTFIWPFKVIQSRGSSGKLKDHISRYDMIWMIWILFSSTHTYIQCVSLRKFGMCYIHV